MVRTYSEIMEMIKSRVGDDSSDETIRFIEDISDTLNDYEARLGDSTDWKAKYEENDKEWREKYRSRFFDTIEKSEDVEETEEETEDEKKTFVELFKEED